MLLKPAKAPITIPIFKARSNASKPTNENSASGHSRGVHSGHLVPRSEVDVWFSVFTGTWLTEVDHRVIPASRQATDERAGPAMPIKQPPRDDRVATFNSRLGKTS